MPLAQAKDCGRFPVRVIVMDRERTYNGLFPSSALNPYFMQIRALGAAIGNTKEPIKPGVSERELLLHAGPFFADITKWRKRFSRGLAAMKEKEHRGERIAASIIAFIDKAAQRHGGEHK
jgi:hypothetical protein